MKDRKKQRGMKAEIRASKKRSEYMATVVVVAILVAIIAIASFLIYSYLNPSSNQTSTTQLKAAIVDHLSLTAPNQTFIQTARNMLETANYTVDYYPRDNVSVEFYRNLPKQGYSLMILRVHSTFKDESVVLFTSERYSTKEYREEQMFDRLGAVAYTVEEAKQGIVYFGIMPSFVEHSMKGRFNNAVIVMMGCDGLKYTSMAEAFVQKGARVYISWNGPVSASHTDQATTQLLEHLITEKQAIKQAVTETMKEVGPDPVDESILIYYPTTSEAENYVIPEPKSNLTTITTNVAETNPKIEKLKDEC